MKLPEGLAINLWPDSLPIVSGDLRVGSRAQHPNAGEVSRGEGEWLAPLQVAKIPGAGRMATVGAVPREVEFQPGADCVEGVEAGEKASRRDGLTSQGRQGLIPLL